MGARSSGSGAERERSAGRTITVPWRSVAAMVPAAVLTASGIALAQGGTPSTLADRRSVPSVPQQALTQPPTTAAGIDPASTGVQPADPGLAPGLALPPGTQPGSSQSVRLDSLGIPAPALTAYRLAASLVGQADPACGIDWALVGAIGRVESDHARFGGNALDARGVARPGIIGIPLDGSRGTARIGDTDDGRWDRDTVYDRAVGPMQFIPGTWRVVGSDADGDGDRNPQDMNDAATATAVYLCSGPGDLRQDGDLYSAIRRYNNSDSYVRTVIAIAAAYRRGVSELPASSLPAAHSASTGGGSVEAAGASTRTAVGGGAGGGASSSTRTSGGSAGGGAGGGGQSTAPQPGGQPTSASVPAGGGAVGSVAAPVVSTVTSVVTGVITTVAQVPTVLPVPCISIPGITLPVGGCSTTTTVPVTKTSTTTSTRTTTVTRKP